MRLLMTGMTLFVALYLTAPTGVAFAPKPALCTSATVTFRDAGVAGVDGDAIRSNGAAYVDGANPGLEVRVWINGSQDLIVGSFRSGRTNPLLEHAGR